jgi:Putative zinc-finger
MSTHDSYTNRLSDYLDDEDLTPREREAIGAHLEDCAPCRATLEELREVAARASALVDTPPVTDLWPGVAGRLAPPPRRPFALFRRTGAPRRFSFTLPQLVAASLALMVTSGGAVWLARHGGSQTELPAISSQEPAPAALTPASVMDAHYDQAIADLEKILDDSRSKLDPETVRILQENLRTIDQAIEQCRRALADDAADPYLNSHLADAKQRKLALLRRANALADQEG